MNRRKFFFDAAATGLASTIALPSFAQSGGKYKKARLRLVGTQGARRSYNLKKIADPTGTAPSRKIERFELRGGDCSSKGDCAPRPLNTGRVVTRTRVEKVLDADLKLGEHGLFRYSVYFPSDQYNQIDSVSSAFGQVLSAFKRGQDYNSFPIFSLTTADGPSDSSLLYVGLSETRETELEREKHKILNIGSLHNAKLLDRWIEVQVRFKLSDKKDGFIEATINGRTLGRLTGPTLLPHGYLEVRYGIYQTGTNNYPGGANQMPTQVVYFANVGLFRLV